MVRGTTGRATNFTASLVELPLLLGDDLLEEPPDLAVVADSEGPLEPLPTLADFPIGRSW